MSSQLDLIVNPGTGGRNDGPHLAEDLAGHLLSPGSLSSLQKETRTGDLVSKGKNWLVECSNNIINLHIKLLHNPRGSEFQMISLLYRL